MLSSAALLFAFLIVHLLGLAAAWMVRVHANGRGEALAHGMFFLSLAVVATLAVLGRQYCWSTWTLSAATLSLMIVIAVADFGQVRAGVAAAE